MLTDNFLSKQVGMWVITRLTYLASAPVSIIVLCQGGKEVIQNQQEYVI